MKRALLAFLLLGIAVHAPWRLAALMIETMAVSPGATRVSNDNDAYWECLDLEARLVDAGWQVQYVPELSYHDVRAYGLTNFRTHMIQIDSTLSWNARFAVLAHEGGHTLQRGWLDDEPYGDAFAESVAVLVAHDGLREHARYMARFRGPALFVMLVEWRAIYRAADTLGDR